MTATIDPYIQLLERKAPIALDRGLSVPFEMRGDLKPHAKDVAAWGIRGGNRAFFLNFGLHKTSIQLQVCESLLDAVPDSIALIVCPLGVRREFAKEATERGFSRSPIYISSDAALRKLVASGQRLFITNYERVRDGGIDVKQFQIVTLDEASVLRSFGSKTYQEFLPMFDGVPYKFVATATPSPNRLKELIHYAGFLGIMDTGQCLTRFFKRDPTKAGNLTLHPHKEREFWLWVSTWACFIQKPSDLGYSDEGYTRPAMEIVRHRLPVDYSTAGYDSWGQGKLIRDAAAGLSAAATEKRDSLGARIMKAREIIAAAEPDRHWLIWHDLEDERRAIQAAIPGAVCIWGTMDLEERERIVEQFADGELAILGTKPILSGSGSNFQAHCYSNIFLGIGYKFNDFVQSLHRTDRFGQRETVETHLIYTESEDPIHDELMRKWREHDALQGTMSNLIREYGLNSALAGAQMKRAIDMDVEIVKSGDDARDRRLRRIAECDVRESMAIKSGDEVAIKAAQADTRRALMMPLSAFENDEGDTETIEAPLFTAVRSDNVSHMRTMPDNSLDLIVTSWPFSDHYEYTETYNDFGHNDGDTGFFEQMEHLTPEVMRTLKPGRMYCVHAKDRIVYGSVSGDGMYTVNPFSDKCVAHLIRHGFRYCGRITVVTDVVRENNQTYRLGWTENSKDGTKMGVGSPEYVLLFRKLPTEIANAYADEPVKHDKPLVENPLCLCGHSQFEHDQDDECKYVECECIGYRLAEMGEPSPYRAGGSMIVGTGYSRAHWQFDAHSFWRSSGDRFVTPEEAASMPMDMLRKAWLKYSRGKVYDFAEHVRIAEEMEKRGILPSSFMALEVPNPGSPHVWDDVTRMRTLNGEQTRRGWENHVCPLQLDIVERLIDRYSNPGEVVCDMFGGIGTVAYSAILKGRKAYTIELNPDYHRDALSYCRGAEQKVSMPTLFDLMAEEGACD